MTVTVHGAAYSTYTRSVLIALREKNVEHGLSEVDIFKPISPEYFDRHPWGKIPALDHDGFRLYETTAITHYIDETFPGTALQPADAQVRARMMQAIGIIDSYAYRPMVTELFVQRAAMPRMGRSADEAVVAAALPGAEKALDALLAVKGRDPWMAGGTFGLADLHFAPVFAYLRETPEDRAMIERKPPFGVWWEEAAKRPSVSANRSPLEA